MKKTLLLIVWLMIAALGSGCASVTGDESVISLQLSAPAGSCVGLPLCAAIDLPGAFSQVPLHEIDITVAPTGESRQGVPGQIECCVGGKFRLWWVAPSGAGKQTAWEATLAYRNPADAQPILEPAGFEWRDSAGENMDLLLDGRKTLRTMYAFDTSTEERQHATYKVYHHVFDETGEKTITKGPGGLYTHHRGLFIGWNKLTIDEKSGDWWHMSGGTQRLREFYSSVAGPVWARSVMAVDWKDNDDKTVIAEKRSITVFRQPDPGLVLVDFHTRLKAVASDVFLNGDAEHAGFQFRAHNGVAEGDASAKAVYLFDRDDVDPKKDFDLTWVGMCYGLGGKRYAVQYMNHPDNPKPTVFSAYRDYGRFGSYFKETIKAGETLELRYRLYISVGELPDRDEMARRFSGYVEPPRVEIKVGS